MPTVRHPYASPKRPSTPFLELLSATFAALRHAGYTPAQVSPDGTCTAPGFYMRESLTAVLDVQHRMPEINGELLKSMDPGQTVAAGAEARLAEQRAWVDRYRVALQDSYRFADMEMSVLTGGTSGIPWLTVKGVLRDAL